ncbi:MAG: sporulation initiation factor Spo0A C-terminal domain-containing protein [Clostridia bacterium]
MNCNTYAADILRAIGMHPRYRGYSYMLHILTMTSEKPEYVHRVSCVLYRSVADEFSVSVTSIERSIRFAIKRTWESGNRQRLMLMFGDYDLNYVPTNCEFIAVMTECLRHKRIKTTDFLSIAN